MTDNNTPTHRHPDVKEHVDFVFDQVVEHADENDLPLIEMGEGVYVNEYGTPRMEDVELHDAIRVAEVGDLGLDTLSETYGEYDSYEKAIRHFAALNLNNLVMDKIENVT